MASNSATIRTLLFSTLYPNVEQPRHGIFVENRLRNLVADCPVEAEVVAPVPWFPLRSPRFGTWGTLARVPQREKRHGFQVAHPRYPVVPRVSWRVAPWLLYSAMRGHVRRLISARPRFDIIDAHYVYPDGVAALLLGREFDLPVVVTARGNDLSLLPHSALPRAFIRWGLPRFDATVGVCDALRAAAVDLGAPAERTATLRNGVDTEIFSPESVLESKARLRVGPKVLLSVGHLIERKGNHLTLQALAALPADWQLLLLGDGPEEHALKKIARDLGIQERVRFEGAVPQAELRWYYSAADALVLASSREGWANVLLESMACGTPVVATAVWGTPEVVASPAAGVLIEDRSAAGIEAGVRRLFANPPDRAETRRYAEQFSWKATSQGQYELFQEVIQRHQFRRRVSELPHQ